MPFIMSGAGAEIAPAPVFQAGFLAGSRVQQHWTPPTAFSAPVGALEGFLATPPIRLYPAIPYRFGRRWPGVVHPDHFPGGCPGRSVERRQRMGKRLEDFHVIDLPEK